MQHKIQIADPEYLLSPDDLDEFRATGKPFLVECWGKMATADTLREALTIAEGFAETAEVPVNICSFGLIAPSY